MLPLIEKRLAETAVGASALRSQGAKGVIAAAREHLRSLNLKDFTDADTFRQRLDVETDGMLARFPDGCNSWGGARKALNLFLRDVLYNRYTAAAYDFNAVEPLMEVPLDHDVAQRLRKEPEGVDLPGWPRLIRLTPSVSDEYQDVALAVAERCGLCRVHIDLLYWRAPVG